MSTSIRGGTIYLQNTVKNKNLNTHNGLYETAMNNGTNYPSCIKIPSTSSVPMFPQKFDMKEALSLNIELIRLANQIFGEGQWSHTVTNQAIDFVEAYMGKYICGCVTFVRIQLQSGTFHEDIGYCHAEGTMKGLAIHYARIGSLTDAFKKVLSCFGSQIENEIQKLRKEISNINNIENADQFSFTSLQAEILEPCARSTPFFSRKNDEEKGEAECRPKSPNDQKQQISIPLSVTKAKSPIEQKGQTSALLKPLNNIKGQSLSKCAYPKEQENIKTEQDQKKALSEEELLRMERKRKQLEKQAEYKRLMKEKDLQKTGDNKKRNPKY